MERTRKTGKRKSDEFESAIKDAFEVSPPEGLKERIMQKMEDEITVRQAEEILLQKK
jgi:hypothetical protein